MNDDYPVYVKWLDATDWILNHVEKFPKSVRFTISGRIANLCLDVMERIIEAIYTRNRTDILNRINLDLEKLRVLFRICHKRQYLSVKQYEYISEIFMETGKMIGGWEKSV